MNLDMATTVERMAAASAAVASATNDEEKKAVAKSVLDGLTPEQQLDLFKSRFPTESKHKMWIYLLGITAAVIVGLAALLIAWGAGNDDQDAVVTAAVAVASGVPGLILGGLFGAYVQQG